MAATPPTAAQRIAEISWFRRNFDMINRVTGYLATVAFIGVVVMVLIGPRGLDGDYILENFWTVFSPMAVGVTVTAIAFVLGIGIGFFVGWIRVSAAQAKMPPFRRTRDPEELAAFRALPSDVRLRIQLQWALWFIKQGGARICYGYIEMMRGTPIFVQIFFVWSVLLFRFASLGPAALAFWAGVVALTMNTGAYQAEIFRGGLQAVQQGQIEAARAVGLSYWATMRHITLPQAFRLIIPPLTNEFIGLLKASALLYTVGLHETTAMGYYLTQRSLKVFEVFFMVTASYLLVTLPLAWGAKFLERLLRIPGLGLQDEPQHAGRARTRREALSAAVLALDVERWVTGSWVARRVKSRPATAAPSEGQ